MSGSFAEAAHRLAGRAGAALGWGPARFWAATPAELCAVADALAGDGDAGAPPDAETLARLRREHPDG